MGRDKGIFLIILSGIAQTVAPPLYPTFSQGKKNA